MVWPSNDVAKARKKMLSHQSRPTIDWSVALRLGKAKKMVSTLRASPAITHPTYANIRLHLVHVRLTASAFLTPSCFGRVDEDETDADSGSGSPSCDVWNSDGSRAWLAIVAVHGPSVSQAMQTTRKLLDDESQGPSFVE